MVVFTYTDNTTKELRGDIKRLSVSDLVYNLEIITGTRYNADKIKYKRVNEQIRFKDVRARGAKQPKYAFDLKEILKDLKYKMRGTINEEYR